MKVRAVIGRLVLVSGRESEQAAKAIWPAIYWINTSHPKLKEAKTSCFIIYVKWWDWALYIYYITNLEKDKSQNE